MTAAQYFVSTLSVNGATDKRLAEHVPVHVIYPARMTAGMDVKQVVGLAHLYQENRAYPTNVVIFRRYGDADYRLADADASGELFLPREVVHELYHPGRNML